MGHQLKYFKELLSQGHQWRLEIYQDTDDVIAAVEIGPVLQGLRLIVQGDQADIDTPIVKTSLEMVFVDAPDLETERKCGYWEEFYTSSATEYRVSLIKDGVVEWTGFITPDSFSESLQYRGSVTIIARDNLGSLQDFEYNYAPDSSGMVSISALILKALEVVSFPMKMRFIGGGSRAYAQTLDSVLTSEVWDVLLNNKSFKDMTWLEVIEDILSSVGLVIRYVGSNQFVLASLRDIPLYDKEYWPDVEVKPVIFRAFGQRELTPAAKSIISEVSFDIEENFAEVVMPADAYGEAGEYTLLTDSENLQEIPMQYPMPIHAVVNGSWSARDVDTSLYLNPFAFPLKAGHSSIKEGDLRDTSVVYIACNTSPMASGRTAEWKFEVGPGKYKFSFAIDKPVALYDDNTQLGHADVLYEFSRFTYNLRFIANDGAQNKEYRTSSNSWISGNVEDPNSLFPNVGFPIAYEFPELEVSTIGEIQLLISYVGVVKKNTSPAGESKGAYLPFKDFTLTDVNLYNTAIPNSQKISTQYSPKNNIIVRRYLAYAFNSSDVANPRIIKNGLFVLKDGWYESSDQWAFHPLDDEPKMLPVLIHQQLLAYNAKPNNILSGELVTDNPTFNALYEWNGKKHLFVSGAFNVITGYMENVVLREFTRYDHMWETWVEGDEVEVDYVATSIQLRVHSNKTITSADLNGIPLWMIGSVQAAEDGVYVVSLAIEANSTTLRKAMIGIDTAFVRVIQFAPGDYGLDYGEDYS